MAHPLPDPAWAPHPAYCLRCGYSLQGLVAPGLCPECGAAFDREVLVLCGLPRRPGGPVWRRAVWTLLIGGGVVYGHLWAFFLINMAWELSLTLGLAIAIGVSAMLITGPRERRGRERFFLSRAGVTRMPFADGRPNEGVDSLFTPWGDANDLEVKRHSAFWRRVRIGHRRGPGHSPFDSIFDAGVRCPDNDADHVLTTIRAYLSRAGPSAPPSA